MNITAKEVNQLRQKTGSGMMDCKKALIASQGDIEKAVDFLRKKGEKIASARNNNKMAQGAVFIKTNQKNTIGVAITLCCETDFVANNTSFQELGESILDYLLIQNPIIGDITSLNNDKIVQTKITNLIGKVGEKIAITAYEFFSENLVISYIHPGSKVGVLVGMQGEAPMDNVLEAGKNIAMQIAAMNPIALSENDVDKAIIQRELTIAKEQAREEGKAAHMLDAIAQGRLNKFFKETTLLNQIFVKDNAYTIKKYIQAISPKLTITSFKRLSI